MKQGVSDLVQELDSHQGIVNRRIIVDVSNRLTLVPSFLWKTCQVKEKMIHGIACLWYRRILLQYDITPSYKSLTVDPTINIGNVTPILYQHSTMSKMAITPPLSGQLSTVRGRGGGNLLHVLWLLKSPTTRDWQPIGFRNRRWTDFDQCFQQNFSAQHISCARQFKRMLRGSWQALG